MENLNLSELRDKCLNSLNACTNNVSKYLKEDERIEEFDKMRRCVMEYCKMEQQEKAGLKALESFEKETDLPDWTTLQAQFDDKLTQHIKHNAKFDKHQYMREFEKHVRRAQQNEELSQSSDIAITKTVDTYIDPFTKRQISDPVRNNICQHVYDKKTAESIISNRKNRGCPYLLCSNKQPMEAAHLEPDEELRSTIQQTQLVQQSQEF